MFDIYTHERLPPTKIIPTLVQPLQVTSFKLAMLRVSRPLACIYGIIQVLLKCILKTLKGNYLKTS